MEKLRNRIEVSFSAKVLVPVVAVMVLLLGITVWTVNTRITQQSQAEAARSLATADGVFRKFQEIRKNNLVLRYRNLRNEPRYRAVLQSGDLPTLREEIKDLPDEQGLDIALFTTTTDESLASAKANPLKPMPVVPFQARSAESVRRAMQGQENVDTILVGERLFDVISIPVTGQNGQLVGVLTFGSEIRRADVAESSSVSQCEIVLLADGRVIASTIANSGGCDFVKLFN